MSENKLAIKEAFEDSEIRNKFNRMLGNKATGFIISVINIVNSDTELAKCDRNSVLYAAATAAAMDLPINPNLGFAYIIAYNGMAQFQMGYKGFIQLAQRSGQFQTISACPVYEGQLVSNDPLRGIVFDFSQKLSDKIVGFAGYFKLLNGFEKTLYMTVEEMTAHGLKYSQSFKSTKQWVKDKSLWTTNFESMGCKTVIKLLLSKFAPLSIEMQKAVLTDQSIVSDWEGENLSYPDNDKKESAEDVSQRKERERVSKYIEKCETLEQLEEVFEFIDPLDEEDEIKNSYLNKFKEFRL